MIPRSLIFGWQLHYYMDYIRVIQGILDSYMYEEIGNRGRKGIKESIETITWYVGLD